MTMQLEYRGYAASANFDGAYFHGAVRLGRRAELDGGTIEFYGRTQDEARGAFIDAVLDYIAASAGAGQVPLPPADLPRDGSWHWVPDGDSGSWTWDPGWGRCEDCVVPRPYGHSVSCPRYSRRELYLWGVVRWAFRRLGRL